MLAPVAALLALALPALVIVAAVKDVTSFTIPNWISLALAAAFAPAALAAGLPLTDVGVHLAVGLGALVAGMVLFALRWIGGGDAKLFAAAALWLGLAGLPSFLLATAVAGGGLSLLVLWMRRPLFRPVVLMGPSWVVRLAEPKEGIPYGVAIAVGALAAFPHAPFLSAFAAL
ncbi:prepilin peptidase [Phenylobacterium sp. J426]|uniref:A24 family peptidase n=1 Tax=Phenylobacterium sp. J426 TaxID=2898439 RepID=UPI002151039B|nr:prepilin peptidase [Phenylobacterium sp. J426]MCR5873482.1 prepilin peptidase [Phenylobacterium sp. J426]